MSGFSFAAPRRARRPSLTPMIDVVFLLLVFFMLAARFGQDTAVILAPPAPSQVSDWSGPPRLVTLKPSGIYLNGRRIAQEGLIDALAPLMRSPADPIVLRAQTGVPLQTLVDMLDALNGAGLTGAVLVE